MPSAVEMSPGRGSPTGCGERALERQRRGLPPGRRVPASSAAAHGRSRSWSIDRRDRLPLPQGTEGCKPASSGSITSTSAGTARLTFRGEMRLDHTAPKLPGTAVHRCDGNTDEEPLMGPARWAGGYRSCGGTCRPTSRARDDGLAKGSRVRSEVGSGARIGSRAPADGGAPVPPGRATPTIIEPIRGWPRPDLRELLRYRELLYFLVWRNIKVRYKQTAIGAAWAVLQPFLATIVVVLVFGGLSGSSLGRPLRGVRFHGTAGLDLCVGLRGGGEREPGQ